MGQWSDGGKGGSFSPSTGARNPSYTAPRNISGQDVTVVISCKAFCSVDPSANQTKTVSLVVRWTAHTVTITSGPSANPSIVESSGSTSCTVSAVDSGGHAVNYSWIDNGKGGSFSPSASVQNPTYVAPPNKTGQDVAVTLTCTAKCAIQPSVADTKSRVLTVHSVRHSVTITNGPSADPSVVARGGVSDLSASATDSLDHAVLYEWSDGGAGGMFVPGEGAQSPIYCAPTTAIPQDTQIILSCAACCAEDSHVGNTKTVPLTVKAGNVAPPQVLIAAPPPSSGCILLRAPIVITFSRSMDTQATEDAVLIVPAVGLQYFSWSPDSSILTIKHGGLQANTAYTVTVSTAARDTMGIHLASPYTWGFATVPYYSRFDPDHFAAPLSATVASPHVVSDDPAKPQSIRLGIGIPEGITLDTTPSGTALACIEKGDNASLFFAEWDAYAREIAVVAYVEWPGATTEIVKSITMTLPGTHETLALTIDDCPALFIRSGLIPGDFNWDQKVNVEDAYMFVGEWVRWHPSPPPAPQFDPDIDGPYDLYPHTSQPWPHWMPIGDRVININDASSFIGCWMAAHATLAVPAAWDTYAPGPSAAIGSRRIVVPILSAPGGIFRADIRLPAKCVFDPAVDQVGNLRKVVRGKGVGMFFFTEYDAATRTIRMTGDVTGSPPYIVATIYHGG